MKTGQQSQNLESTSTWDDIIAGILSKLPGATTVDEYAPTQDDFAPIPQGNKDQFGKFRQSMDERFRRENAQRMLHIMTGNPNLEDPLNNVNSRSRMDSVPDRQLWKSEDRLGHRYPDEGLGEDYDFRGDEHGDMEDLERGEGPLRGKDVKPPVDAPAVDVPAPEGVPMSSLEQIILAVLRGSNRRAT